MGVDDTSRGSCESGRKQPRSRKWLCWSSFLCTILFFITACLTGYCLLVKYEVIEGLQTGRHMNISNQNKRNSNRPSDGPSVAPSIDPTSTPSRTPSATPTLTSSSSPSTSSSSTPTRSWAPTSSPYVTNLQDFLSTTYGIAFDEDDPETLDTNTEVTTTTAVSFRTIATTTANRLAVEWLGREAARQQLPQQQQQTQVQGYVFDDKIVQRFALLSLDFALHNAQEVQDTPYNAKWGVDACFWTGIVCHAAPTAAPTAVPTPTQNTTTNTTTNTPTTDTTPTSRASLTPGRVTEIHWGSQVVEDGALVSTTNTSSGNNISSGGHISSTIRLLRPSLTTLDFSNNQLRGTIPEELYSLEKLQKLFLYKNNLEGTLSTLIGDLDAITHLHLSHNQLGGTIPLQLTSDQQQGSRPLEYFNLYSNQFTGTIPKKLHWQHLFYFDIGRNVLTGTLPSELGASCVALRHLHLDHNDLRGTLPSSYNTIGNGRLESFSINHNQLTGLVPGDRELYNTLVQYTLHENRFSRIQINNCRLEVPQGECVEFRADCDICRCNGSLNLCERTCHRT